jgi:Leucine-rich repeat (LRR) protein
MGQQFIRTAVYAVSENSEGRNFGNSSTNSCCGVRETSRHSVSPQARSYNWDALQQFLQPGLPRTLASKVSYYLLDALTHLIKGNELLCYNAAVIDHDPGIDMLVLAAIYPRMSELVLYHCPDYLCLVLCKQLHRFTELKVLKIHAIPTKSIKLAVRDVVESNIRSLKNLVDFVYVKHCTDSILIVLSRYCRQLEHLSVMFSKKVTVQSVESIKKFQNLKTLNIWGTSITKQYCCQLLDILLKLEDFSSDQEDILEGVSERPLVLKSLTTTHLKNLQDLVSLCFYLTRLTLYAVNCDLTYLRALTSLRELAVSNCSFSVTETFLRSRGEQLTFLKLKEVSAVIMEFITYCTQLKTLHLSVCTFISLTGDLSSLHYKNLEHLTIRGYHMSNFDILLSAYTKLKTLKLLQVPVLGNEIIVDAVTAGKWEQMEVVSFNECVEVETLMYIVNNCYNLRKIIYKVTENPERSELLSLCSLEQYLKQNNLDIEMVL